MPDKNTKQTNITNAADTVAAPEPAVDDSATSRTLRQWMLPVALFVAPLVLLLVYRHVRTPPLINLDAFDFAQIGHNVESGRGFVTYTLRPLALTHASDALHQPDVTHGPLYPIILAVAFGAFGAKNAVVMGVSGLFYLLTIPMLYLLGARVFNRNVGLVAAAVFALNVLVLEYAVSGMHVTLYCFLATALFLVLYNVADGTNKPKQQNKHPKPSGAPLQTGQLILAGLLTGLLYLTDPIFFWLIPVVLIFVTWLSAPRGLGAAAALLTPIAIVALPWMIRNAGLTGNPIFGVRGMELWMNTIHHYPGELAYRLFPEQMAVGPSIAGSLIRKLLMGMAFVVNSLPQICASWILAFLLPSLLFRYTVPAANKLRGVMLCCVAALIFGMLLFHVDMLLLVATVPVMLVFASGYLEYLVQQAQPNRSLRVALAALLVVALTYPLCSQMAFDDKVSPLTEETAARGLDKLTKPGDVILSDLPQAVAWYSDRPSVLIPARDESITDVRKQFADARWLFLSPRVRGYSPQWQFVYDKFQSWNTQYVNARNIQAQPPTPLHILGRPASVQNAVPDVPLFRALAGFSSVEPVDGAGVSTVLARVSPPEISLLQRNKTTETASTP